MLVIEICKLSFLKKIIFQIGLLGTIADVRGHFLKGIWNFLNVDHLSSLIQRFRNSKNLNYKGNYCRFVNIKAKIYTANY